jgi:UPF0716 protein FxsA
MGRRLRTLLGLWVLLEIAVFVLVAWWIGIGWTILATLATSGLGLLLIGKQGTRTLAELRERARAGEPPGRALGDAGLIAVGGLLMVLPGFVGDLVGLLCLLPLTRPLPRALITRVFAARLPVSMRGPVRVRSSRTEQVDRSGTTTWSGSSVVIEGEVAEGPENPPGDGPLQVESRRVE